MLSDSLPHWLNYITKATRLKLRRWQLDSNFASPDSYEELVR